MRMMKPTYRSHPWIALASALVGMSFFAYAGGAHADDVTAAVWKSHAMHFNYVGRTTAYSCDTLISKVARVLAVTGVRDMRIDAKTCIFGGGQGQPLVQLASMQLDFRSPTLATAAAKAEIAEGAARRELLQRLGVSAPPSEEFPAVWKQVNLGADRRLQLDAGDCELLRQLTRQVLSEMAVEIVSRNPSCSLSPQRHSKARLKIRALTPADDILNGPELAGLR
jgi:hypothetical protein